MRFKLATGLAPWQRWKKETERKENVVYRGRKLFCQTKHAFSSKTYLGKLFQRQAETSKSKKKNYDIKRMKKKEIEKN